MNASLPIGFATFGFINDVTRDDALRQIAEAGYELVEVTTCPPHIDLSDFGPDQRRQLSGALERYGLRCVATNAVELNPVSPNADIAALAFKQYRGAIELAAELGAASVVMITGRANPLIPAPEAQAKDRLRRQLDRLLPVADALGVTLALEPVPFGFMQSGAEVASFIDDFGAAGLAITLDCANLLFAGHDPVEDLLRSREHVKLVHISDTWRDRFAHTQVGRADVDFGAFASALREVGYSGPTIYELVDGQDPAMRMREDRPRLAGWGWA